MKSCACLRKNVLYVALAWAAKFSVHSSLWWCGHAMPQVLPVRQSWLNSDCVGLWHPDAGQEPLQLWLSHQWCQLQSWQPIPGSGWRWVHNQDQPHHHWWGCRLPFLFGCIQLHGIWQHHDSCQCSFAVVAKLIDMLHVVLLMDVNNLLLPLCDASSPSVHYIIMTSARPYTKCMSMILIANMTNMANNQLVSYWNQCCINRQRL